MLFILEGVLVVRRVFTLLRAKVVGRLQRKRLEGEKFIVLNVS